MTRRRLTAEQQGYVEDAVKIIPVVIAAFLRSNPNDKEISGRVDLVGTAQTAVCLAALTYDPAKAGISAYFSVAIRRLLTKEIASRRRHEGRMRVGWGITVEPASPPAMGRMTKALSMLPLDEKQLIEDYYVSGVTLERLSREQNSHIKTVRKRIRRALEKLRIAEKELP